MFNNIISAIRIILFSSEGKIDVRNIKYLPRWVVLGIDVYLIIQSVTLAVLLLDDVLGEAAFISSFWNVAAVIAVNIAMFFIFKTYAGLIRHSSYMDAFKLMLSSLSTFATLVILNFVYTAVYNEPMFMVIGLILYMTLSFTFLLLFRLIVKQFYTHFTFSTVDGSLSNAVILGADENAISIAGALQSENPRRFKIKGFIAKGNFNSNIRILDKPVLNFGENFIQNIQRLDANSVILSDGKLSSEEKFALVAKCLERDIKVYNAPLVSNWQSTDAVTKGVRSLRIEDLLDRDPITLNKKSKERQIKGKTILVTGGAGSIGSEIVRQVAELEPGLLLILDQAETPLHNLSLEIKARFPDLNLKFVITDVCNKNRLELLMQNHDIDVIYHAAAYKHVPLMESNPHEAILTNIMGTKNLADLAVDYGVDKFVMVSTDKAVNPSNVMGASKRAAEMYVQSLYFCSRKNIRNKTKFITTRFGNVLGSNGSVVPLFKKQIEKGGPITITHPDIIRYFMTIPEACQLVLEAGAMGKGGEIFIFDMGEPVKIMDLATKMIRLAGFVPGADIKIKITGLRPGEKLYEELLTDHCETLPTHHEKIMISQDPIVDHDTVDMKVAQIVDASFNLKDIAVVQRLKALVPEFKSMNSTFEQLDVVEENTAKMKVK